MIPESDLEAAWVRAVFAEAAQDVAPGPVPLADVRRRGRARRVRRSAALAGLGVVSAAAVAVVAVASVTLVLSPSDARQPSVAVRPSLPAPLPTPSPSASISPSASSPPAVEPPRTVRPDERVDAGRGWTVWLTAQGKYWTGPDDHQNFRSVTDGNLDLTRPGVSHQSEGDATGVFHSGVYYGPGAARVELTDSAGTKTDATLLQLPGRPGWGVWYAHTRPPSDGLAVTLYDAAGKALTDLPGGSPFGGPGANPAS
ncbi:hypothetical protein [Streptomyces sp. NBC_01565]|uniref:hypothetical protein n=1 Tax=unclassified Streptomyces TaxID=2593676 RepID=UPI002259303F|nr:hypothetical protein [Streptomyces sp. NBC_01565]MCX4545938.1 hypothetical protein [Streptomyces sp. NBC_01565]